MSGAPQTQPLAALLASHPEECAAVVAALCARGEPHHGVNDRTPTALVIAIWPDGDIEEQVDLVLSILVALDDAGATSHAGTMYRELAERDRYAIARMGAGAWLRARCSITATTPEERAATVRDLEAAFRRGDGVEVASSRETGAGAPAKGEQR